MSREKAIIKAAVFLDHLSIKGYEWEELTENSEYKIKKNAVRYQINNNDEPDQIEEIGVDVHSVCFQKFIPIFEKEKNDILPQIRGIVNDLNKIGIVRYFIHVDDPEMDDGIHLTAFYIGEYEKESFDYFLSWWEYGVSQVFDDYVGWLKDDSASLGWVKNESSNDTETAD